MLSNIFLNILHLLLLLTYIERCTKTRMRRTGVCTGVCAFKPKLAPSQTKRETKITFSVVMVGLSRQLTVAMADK